MPVSPASRALRQVLPRARWLALLLGALTLAAPSRAENSALDAPLFFQLLIGEIELRSGDAGTAYQAILDAARRTRDETLFRRAVEIAVQARAGDQALAAARAWRVALPRSTDALRYELQLLLTLNRTAEATPALRALLSLTPASERVGLIGVLAQLFQRVSDKRLTVSVLQDALKDYLEAPATRTASRVTLAQALAGAGERERALELAARAMNDDPGASRPALFALELMPGQAGAEELVKRYLGQPSAEFAVRLAYVRTLSAAQRYADAIAQLEIITQRHPELALPHYSLGALRLELKQLSQAEASLMRYLELSSAHAAADAPRSAASAPAPTPVEESGDSDDRARRDGAYLLLAQIAEQRGDFAAAQAWLARTQGTDNRHEVAVRHAAILARQGKVAEARALLRALPERNSADQRGKLLAEAQVMREAKQWTAAHEVLTLATQRFADDVDILYELSMAAEKLNRMDEMEGHLRRVIALKPEHHHAHNALGYSLADRNLRLPEARELIRRALALAPGDPFITDSLGWVEYRLGNRSEALRLLRLAYSARPDVEIAAHLGEVLWVDGQKDDARHIWRDARSRDADNETLKETLLRLKAEL